MTAKLPLIGQNIRTDVSTPIVEGTSTTAAALAYVKFIAKHELNKTLKNANRQLLQALQIQIQLLHLNCTNADLQLLQPFRIQTSYNT